MTGSAQAERHLVGGRKGFKDGLRFRGINMKKVVGIALVVFGGGMGLWLLSAMPSGGETAFYIGYFLPVAILVGIGILLMSIGGKSGGK